MFNYSNNGITVASILDDRRSIVDGCYPVKIRITYKRVRKYYSTGKNLSLTDWEKLPETKNRSLIAIRLDIQYSFDKIKGIVQELEKEDIFSFEALSTRLGKGTSDTLNTAFCAKMDALLANDQVGTYTYYKDLLKSIESFAGEKIPFSAVTVDWVRKYEKHQLDTGKNYTTIGIRCRGIRAIMNEARKLGIIKESQYPFGQGKYEIPTGQGRKLALNLGQIKAIVTYTDGNEVTERYRDLWFFSYLCNGLNFADLLRLKYANIVRGEIYFVRTKTVRTSKTKREVCAVITPEMQAIIDRWGNEDKKANNYIFPYLTGDETPMQVKVVVADITRRCNRRMKLIGEAVGIDGISTYTARHSYATVLKRSGANIAYISESLGHSDLKTTENYLASFEREEREKNARLLTNFDIQ